MYQIRRSEEADLARIMEIYAHARAFMAEHGNPTQWGPSNWPPEALVRKDIEDGDSYVCTTEEGEVIGVFYYTCGDDIDPTYRVIEDGEWEQNCFYGVVHRIASDGEHRGVGACCIDWAFAQCGRLRMDTHGDNYVMQNLLKKLGFEQKGIIHVVEDNYPRLAYERM